MGVSYGVMQLNKPSAWEAAADAKNVTAPKNTRVTTARPS